MTGDNRRAIVFTGFMAAGKTAAAAALAERLRLEVRDSDAMVEASSGKTVAQLFEAEGEAGFREREENAVLELLGGDAGIVALGGGALTSERVREALGDHLVVWCDVDEDTAWERASRDKGRPLASDRAAFARLLDERRPHYEMVGDVVLPANARHAAGDAAPWISALRSRTGLRMVWAESPSGSYPAVVGGGAASVIDAVRGTHPEAVPQRAFAVADQEVWALHRGLMPGTTGAIEVEGSEASKTLAGAERVLRDLAKSGVRRDDMVIAVGGGVVGDLAGFCAATYQRGVPVVQVPSTLVAQVDAAYGGKTGVDLPEAKNYVGAYHQPLAVLTDPAMLSTLPAEEFAAGFAEVVKTGLLAGGGLWERVRAIRLAQDLDPPELNRLVFDCARTKIEIVASDERDGGRRQVLNLGHTVAHAIETVTGYGRYRHGEAVALGLLAALRLSGADDLRDEVAELLAANGLPVTLDASVHADAVVEATALDKKASAAGVGFVLLERPGEPRWDQLVEADRVRAAVTELSESDRP